MSSRFNKLSINMYYYQTVGSQGALCHQDVTNSALIILLSICRRSRGAMPSRCNKLSINMYDYQSVGGQRALCHQGVTNSPLICDIINL